MTLSKLSGTTPMLQKNRLADQVLDQIMSWVMDGTLEMGDKLNTEELSAVLGISRMPVREALAVLEQRGLAVSVPYAGMKLVELSDEEAAEIYSVRQLLEPEAAALACQFADEEETARIEEALYEHIAAISAKEQDVKLIHLKNRAFHMSLFRASHKPRLCAVIEEQWDLLSFFKMLYSETLVATKAGRDELISEHEYYLECVRRHDSEHIKQAIYDDIEDKKNKFLALGSSVPRRGAKLSKEVAR